MAANPEPVSVDVKVPQGPTERKTGLYGAHVVTIRLARDDRGWLRLAS